MKNLVAKICILFIFSAIIFGCSGNNELFKITDSFVESLYSTYESYGAFGSSEFSQTTSDGLYRVMPIGRLINVRIEKVVEDSEYEKLLSSLEKHYKNDTRVNQVYINRGGTIIIDCRRVE